MQSETTDFSPGAAHMVNSTRQLWRPTDAATWWNWGSIHVRRLRFWPIRSVMWKRDVIHKTGST